MSYCRRAAAPALIVEEIGLPVAQHDVSRLKIAIEKVAAIGAQQKLCQPAEIFLQRLFVEGDSGEAKKVILEVIQIPRNRLPVEARARIADLVIQIPPGFHLEARQHFHRLAIGRHHFRSNLRARAMLGEKLEQRGVSEILFQVGALAEIFRINLRHRKAVAAKVPGEFDKRDVLFPHVVEDANGAATVIGEADDGASRSAESALHRAAPAKARNESAARIIS